MTNLEAIRSQCKLICNTCYVDDDVIALIATNNSIDPTGEYTSDDVTKVVTCAILVVRGWVETSRSEGGISVAVDQDKIEQNLLFWCNRYGLDSSELLDGSLSTIENGSQLW